MNPMILAGGRVIDPSRGLDKVCDVALRDGRVAGVGRRLSRDAGVRVIDAEGLIVAPGLIDPHVHLREPGGEHKETIATGAAAAAAGGFTSVCCMPNTSPSLDTPELIRFVESRAASAACRVFAVGAATRGRRGEELAEIALMRRAGAVAFSDDGDCVASAGVMSRVLAACADAGATFMQHCQDPTLTRGASMHAGSIATRLGLVGWPRAAEEIIIERDVRLNRAAGCRYHAQHVSSEGSVEIIRRARREGLPVSGEASPHHLLLTHEACDGYETLAKVNPPLREKRDVEALRKGVADGTITVLATDHAPHSEDEKSLPFEDAPFGFIGLESALGLYHEALVASGVIGWPRLIRMMTVEPAALCGLSELGLGTLGVGAPADVTLIDPECRWTFDRADLAGRSANSPFFGRRLRARAVMTIVHGEVKHSRLEAERESDG